MGIGCEKVPIYIVGFALILVLKLNNISNKYYTIAESTLTNEGDDSMLQLLCISVIVFVSYEGLKSLSYLINLCIAIEKFISNQ